MRLNHPETQPLTLVCGIIVFHETHYWCQKGWGGQLWSNVSGNLSIFLRTLPPQPESWGEGAGKEPQCS